MIPGAKSDFIRSRLVLRVTKIPFLNMFSQLEFFSIPFYFFMEFYFIISCLLVYWGLTWLWFFRVINFRWTVSWISSFWMRWFDRWSGFLALSIDANSIPSPCLAVSRMLIKRKLSSLQTFSRAALLNYPLEYFGVGVAMYSNNFRFSMTGLSLFVLSSGTILLLLGVGSPCWVRLVCWVCWID